MMRILIIVICFMSALKVSASLNPVIDSIPMKDGRKLAADIYKPAGMNKGPVILIQTPYNRLLYRLGLPLGIGIDLDASNYIIVVADWRGFYGSRRAGYIGSPDRGTDGYWAVEWIAAQSWSNGKVGTWGPSALGKVQFQTAETNPPHLTCICPLVAGPQFDYDEYYPNGALRTEYLEQLDVLGFGISPTVMMHPYYDATWTYSENLNFYPDSIRVPAFMVGGWYDHNIEVMLDFFKGLQNESPSNVRNQHKLLMGPWVHGGHGTAQVGTTLQGQLNYPNSANTNDTQALQFFDYHLRGINNGWDQKAPITYYQMGENKWQTTTAWPPANTRDVVFYLHGDKTMDHMKSIKDKDSLFFMYDPQDPSPTVGGPTLRKDLNQGPYDQSAAVENRSDILMFTSQPLKEDAILKGKIKVNLKISSDRIDTDIAVRITDVYPDGRSMLVNDGIMRMRFRNGLSQAQVAMMTPGKIYDCVIELPNTSISFLAGHRIRIDISSSNYPRFNRNMNTGGNMYPGNSLDSLINPVIARNTVYMDKSSASSVTFPLQGYKSSVADINSPGQLKLYPNPAGNSLHIQLPVLPDQQLNEVYIVDQLGKQVMTAKAESDRFVINLSGLPVGIYFVRVETSSGAFCQKFVRQ